MLKILLALGLILAWFGFAAFVSVSSLHPGLEVGLALIGIVLTLVILALSGRLTKKDPFRLNLTGDHPHY